MKTDRKASLRHFFRSSKKVARQGVVAAVLTEEEVTWINFYDTTGGEIAKMGTTVKKSVYPMDIALFLGQDEDHGFFSLAGPGRSENQGSFL